MNEEIKAQAQVGSDNIFADLDLPNPKERLIKAELARRISKIISQRGLTQIEAAELLDIDQPKVSALPEGGLMVFLQLGLFRFLNALGSDIEIVVKPKPEHRSSGKITVIED